MDNPFSYRKTEYSTLQIFINFNYLNCPIQQVLLLYKNRNLIKIFVLFFLEKRKKKLQQQSKYVPLQTIFFSTFILHFTISSPTKVNIISWDSKFRYTRMDIDFHLIGNNNRAQYKKKKNFTKNCYWIFFFTVRSVFRSLLGTIYFIL